MTKDAPKPMTFINMEPVWKVYLDYIRQLMVVEPETPQPPETPREPVHER